MRLTVWPRRTNPLALLVGVFVVAFLGLIAAAIVHEYRREQACSRTGGTWAEYNCGMRPSGRSWVYGCDHHCVYLEKP